MQYKNSIQQFRRSNLLDNLQISKEFSYEYWFILDTLIEVSSIYKDGKGFKQILNDLYHQYLPQYPFSHIILTYANKFKLGFVMNHEQQLFNLKNTKYLFSMLASVNIKLQICESDNLHLSQLEETLKQETFPFGEKLSNFYFNEVKFYMNTYFDMESATIKQSFQDFIAPFKQHLLEVKSQILSEINKRLSNNNSKGLQILESDKKSMKKRHTVSTVSGDQMLENYEVSQEETGVFWLKLDTLMEIATLKTDQRDFLSVIESKWDSFFPDKEYDRDLLSKYISKHKVAYKIFHEEKVTAIRNIKLLYTMLASVILKLNLINNKDHLIQSLRMDIKEEELPFITNMKEHYNKDLDYFFNRYIFTGNVHANSVLFDTNLKTILLPYEDELSLFRDCLIEEINNRIEKNYYHVEEQNDAETTNESVEDVEELKKLKERYELIIAQKNQEIRLLEDELTHHKITGQDEFKFAAEQYDKALKDIVYKLNSPSNGYILDRLHCYAKDKLHISNDNLKMIIQNMFYVFEGIGITTFGNEKIGNHVSIDPKEVGFTYRILNNQIIAEQTEGKVIFPGWMFKNQLEEQILLPPLVEIEEVEEN